VGYIVTIGIAVVSAPACLVAHFVVAIYYCFQQIRPGLPMGRSPAPDRASVHTDADAVPPPAGRARGCHL
jgi:hypothetical protein